MTKTIGIFFAAGKGSRMVPFTEKTPKPLAKVGNKTLLEINMQKAFDLVDFYVVVVSYLKEQIENYFGGSFLGKPIYYANQKNPKGGTLDALRTAIFKQNDFQDYNYLVSGSDDLIADSVYQDLKLKIQENPLVAILVAKKIQDKEILKSKGVFKVDKHQNFIEIVEKPQRFISDLTNIGLYYLPNEIKNFISKKPNSNQLQNQKEEYITDLFNLYSQKKTIKIFSTTDFYHSISTLKDLKKAQEIFN